MAKQSALGRGLGALLKDIDVDAQPQGGSSINEIEISLIDANPDQPRTIFDDDALTELADSIKEYGVISPITLRKIDDGHYQIIAGERRWRAAKLAGLEKIPAYIKTASDSQQVQLMALIENLQREDLNAMEIALSYHKLMNDYNLTQEALSQKIGKKRATVANYVRLLKLPAEIQLGIKDGKIDMGHARALAGIENAADQIRIYERILAEGLNVREVENLVKSPDEIPAGTPKKPSARATRNAEVEAQLSQLLGSSAQVAQAADGSGKITVKFASADELNRIVALLQKLGE